MIDLDKCKITHYPDHVLKTKAAPIEKIDDNIRKLVEKMTDIMIEEKGVGLAGPQAGVPLQIFIISLDMTRENVRAYINPVVTVSGDLDSMEEGCLSMPGVNANIRRYKKCTVTATDLDGNEFTEDADGLYARALQHEYDHICGTTIADKMSDTSKIANKKQFKKLQDQYDNKQ